MASTTGWLFIPGTHPGSFRNLQPPHLTNVTTPLCCRPPYCKRLVKPMIRAATSQSSPLCTDVAVELQLLGASDGVNDQRAGHILKASDPVEVLEHQAYIGAVVHLRCRQTLLGRSDLCRHMVPHPGSSRAGAGMCCCTARHNSMSSAQQQQAHQCCLRHMGIWQCKALEALGQEVPSPCQPGSHSSRLPLTSAGLPARR